MNTQFERVCRSRRVLLRTIFVGALLGFASTETWAGTVRFSLPELLGDYLYDGYKPGLSDYSRSTSIDTPFGLLSVREATVVIAGTITPGQAQGDGILRQSDRVELLASAQTGFFGPNAGFAHLDPEPDSGAFRVEQTFTGPFVSVIPLPGPGPRPHFSFSVNFAIGPHYTVLPPRIGPPGNSLDIDDGIIIDIPITAEVTEAYVLLHGHNIGVPEPHSLALAALGAVALMFYWCKRRDG